MILAICSNLDGKHGVLSPSNKLSDFADDTRLAQYNFSDDTHAQYNFADDTRRAKYQDSGSMYTYWDNNLGKLCLFSILLNEQFMGCLLKIISLLPKLYQLKKSTTVMHQ